MTMFNQRDIAEVRDREYEPGICDEIVSRHDMTPVQVEILGQFIDQIPMDEEELLDFFDCYVDVICESGGGVHA